MQESQQGTPKPEASGHCVLQHGQKELLRAQGVLSVPMKGERWILKVASGFFLVQVFLWNPICVTETASCGCYVSSSQHLQSCIFLFFHPFRSPCRSLHDRKPLGSRGLLCGLRRRRGPSAWGWLVGDSGADRLQAPEFGQGQSCGPTSFSGNSALPLSPELVPSRR